MHCPLCDSIDTGKVGTDQHYCWNCLHEFCMQGQDVFSAYHVDEEGTLVSINERALDGQAVEENLLG